MPDFTFLSTTSTQGPSAPSTTPSTTVTSYPDCVEHGSTSNGGSGWLWAGLLVFVLGVWAGRKLSGDSTVNVHVDRSH